MTIVYNPSSGVVEEANIAGNIRQKISSLGTSLVSFISLRSLDISRNNISSLDGLQYCMVGFIYLNIVAVKFCAV